MKRLRSQAGGRGSLRFLPVTLCAFATLLGCGAEPFDGDVATTAGEDTAAAALTFTAGVGWAARHNMTSAQYQTEATNQVAAGNRLTSISGYTVGGSPRFAGVWEHTTGAPMITRHAMTAAQYQTEYNAQAAAGYRLTLVNGYSVGGVDNYVAIWEQKTGPALIARHGMTAAQYQAEVNTDVAAGYRLVHVSGYEVGGQERYAAIFELKGGPAWSARHGMTAAQYQTEYNNRAAAGYRLIDVSGYTVAGTTRYAAIFEQSGGLPGVAFHGVPGAAYQQKFSDLRYQGYRPALVAGYSVSGGSEQFAGIFFNDAYSAANLNAIDNVVNGAMAATGMPSVSLAIARNGRLVFAKAYGLADKTAGAAATTASLYRVASLSKPITSVAIQRLVEQGLLGYNDKVFGPGSRLGTTYGAHWNDAVLPASYNKLKQVTIRHLLTHTAGGWSNSANDTMFMNPGLSQAQLITWTLDNQALVNTPGTVWDYSNFGYCVLGRVIEKVTGQTYAAWTQANVLGAVGISDMSIAGDTLAARKPNEVVYYSTTENPYGMKVARMDAHGGWIATPIDLTRMLVRVDGVATKPDILQAGTITTMTAPWKAGQGYAQGWSVNSVNNWWHGGSLPGTSTIIVRTSGQFNWAALTNTRDNGPDLDSMMWNVVNAVTAWPSFDLF